MANAIAKLTVDPKALMPDNAQWQHRFQIKSSSSNRLYTVAQNKKNRSWGCSCPGWITHRKCKHLIALGLPCFCQPKEVEVVAGGR